MDRREFISKYWQYYLVLEDDFIKTTRYVELNPANYSTFSIEYTKQYQAICSEVDVLCKEICNFYNDTKSDKFKEYTTTILNNYTDIKNSEIYVGLNSRIKLEPFKGWEADPNYKSLKWWTKYNSVKHKRNINFCEANLSNVINALAGLYVLELYLLRDISKKCNIPWHLPSKKSDTKLFKLKDWRNAYILASGEYTGDDDI